MIRSQFSESLIPSDIESKFMSVLERKSIVIDATAMEIILTKFNFHNIKIIFDDKSKAYPRSRYYQLLLDMSIMFANKIVGCCEDDKRKTVLKEDIDYAAKMIYGRCGGSFPCNPDDPKII